MDDNITDPHRERLEAELAAARQRFIDADNELRAAATEVVRTEINLATYNTVSKYTAEDAIFFEDRVRQIKIRNDIGGKVTNWIGGVNTTEKP